MRSCGIRLNNTPRSLSSGWYMWESGTRSFSQRSRSHWARGKETQFVGSTAGVVKTAAAILGESNKGYVVG